MKKFILICLLVISTHAFAKPLFEIKHWQTKEGMEVYFVQTKQLPILDIRLIFEAGSVYDGEKAGLASLTSALLQQGTKQLTADQIAEGFDSIGAEFFVDVIRDQAELGLRFFAEEKSLKKAIELFHDVVVHPVFPDKEIKRLKYQALTVIKQQQEIPDLVARNVFLKALYGNHPYAHPVVGESQTVSRITRKDILKFHQDHYVANKAVLVLVGDIDYKEARLMASKIVEGLPKKEIPLLSQAPLNKKAINIKIPFPGSQAYVYQGCLGIGYKDPNYFPLFVGNHIFGGNSLGSRLFRNVREKEGLSYAVGSVFARLRYKGLFFISLQTKNNSVLEALNLSKSNLDRFVREGPTEKELDDAKKHLTGSFKIHLDSNAKIADWLTMIGFYHLPLDYLDTYEEKINAVTAKEIKLAFQEIFGKQDWITVIVGERSAYK